MLNAADDIIRLSIYSMPSVATRRRRKDAIHDRIEEAGDSHRRMTARVPSLASVQPSLSHILLFAFLLMLGYLYIHRAHLSILHMLFIILVIFIYHYIFIMVANDKLQQQSFISLVYKLFLIASHILLLGILQLNITSVSD